MYSLTSLYFSEGLLYAAVVAMSTVYFKNVGLDNAWITLWTSVLALPWTIKSLWAPFVDKLKHLKLSLILIQIACVATAVAVAVFIQTGKSHEVILIALGLLGLLSATQDLIIDAIYLTAWTVRQQAQLMWLRNTSFRIAYLIGAGLLISLAGFIDEKHLSSFAVPGWSCAFFIIAVLTAVCAASNWLLLRGSDLDATQSPGLVTVTLKTAFLAFIKIPDVWKIVAYVLVFRLGDALLNSLAQPFLLDNTAHGGLGLKTSLVGIVYGTGGALSLIFGGVAGGYCISKFGAQKLLVPFSLLQSISILFYCFLAVLKPSLEYVVIANSFEQFTFGLTTSCYSIVLLMSVDSRFKATHFAIICAVMNIGLVLPAMASGSICDALGYINFFALSFVLSLTGPLVSFLLPQSSYLQKID